MGISHRSKDEQIHQIQIQSDNFSQPLIISQILTMKSSVITQTSILILLNSIITLSDTSNPQFPSNCLFYQNDVCFDCITGYTINVFGQCIQTSKPNCQVHDITDFCANCLPTYSVIQGNCIKNYNGCINEGPIGQCYQCGYGLQKQGIKCVGIFNCEIADGDQCQLCFSGYILIDNICRDNSQGCLKVRDKDGLCEQCRQGYFMSGYRCFENQYNNRRCTLLQNSTHCLQCRKGYNLVFGYCSFEELPSPEKLDKIIPPLCQIYDPTVNLCLRCFYGYYLRNDQCIQISELCEGHNIETGECLDCKYGYQLQNGDCFHKKCEQFHNNKCIECVSGYKLTQNAGCQFFDINCLDPGIDRCRACRTSNYFINLSGRCQLKPVGCYIVNIQTSQCLECAEGFALQQKSRTCHQKVDIEFCLVYNPLNSVQCLICQQRYYPGNSQCLRVSDLCREYHGKLGTCFNCIHPTLTLVQGHCVDPNCRLLDQNGICSNCVSGYFYSSFDKLCYKSPQNCNQYDNQKRRCLKCLNGYYSDNNGQCIVYPQNCADINGIGVCTRCINQYQLIGSLCVRIQKPQNCEIFDYVNSRCQLCLEGFQINSKSQCHQKQIDPNCRLYDNHQCLECNPRFYMGSEGICSQVSQLCQNYDKKTGQCTSCYRGYNLSEGQCILKTQPDNSDPNCQSKFGKICNQCYPRYYVDLSSGFCVAVNPYCKDHNSLGECLSCYQGYELKDSLCILEQIKDIYCQVRRGDICQQCFRGYYLFKNKCTLVNPLCKGYNPGNGHCLACYQGYSLNPSNGKCQLEFKDPYCIRFGPNSVCLQCSKRYFINSNGKCTLVSPLCKTFNQNTGACKDCYFGYRLENQDCVLEGESKQFMFCKQVMNERCQQCYKGYYLKDNGCIEVNSLCKTYDDFTGACKSCYQGYHLEGDDCLPEGNEGDNLCKTKSGIFCIECYQGYFLIDGACKLPDPACKTINTLTGLCQSCWKGYQLVGHQCLMINLQKQKNNDPYCFRFNRGRCVQCSFGFYYNVRDNLCHQLDPYCASHNMETGNCLSCYDGYTLVAQKCRIKTSINIPNCLEINQHTGFCDTCLQGYYLTTFGNCEPISISCASYHKITGECLTCIQGFYLQNGSCLMASIYDNNCIKYVNSYCSKCKKGYYLIQYSCYQIDRNCQLFDHANVACEICSNGTIPQGAGCK